MNLQYRYILSLSKKENMFYEKTKTKQKDLKKKKVSQGESQTPNLRRIRSTPYLFRHSSFNWRLLLN